MKVAIIVLMFVGVAFAANAFSQQLENLDIDTFLKNRRLVNNYVNCLLEKGNCTPEGREFKRILPEALKSGCSKCDNKGKEAIEKVINYLKSNRQNDWVKLLAKYDPKGEYNKKFETATLQRRA